MKIIQVVELILQKTELRQVHALKTILILLTKELYDFQTAQLLPNVSEELIRSVLDCFATVHRRSSSDSVEKFFTPENASQVSQLMYVLLLLLDKSSCRDVQVKALEALMCHLHVDDSSDPSDIVLRNQISSIVFFAVPMLWSSLSKLILHDAIIGTKVRLKSLVALGRILCLIMEDDRENDSVEKELHLKDFKALVLSPDDTVDDVNSILNQKDKKRTPQWLRAAGMKLRTPLQGLISLAGSDVPNIRKELGKACELWLRWCRISFRDNLDTFAEILLILMEDEEEEISSYFSRVLVELEKESSHSLTVVTRQLLDRHLVRMSRIIQRQSAKELVTALSLLKAQLKVLSKNGELERLLSESRSLDILVRNFLLLLEFNYKNAELLREEHTIRDYVDQSDSVAVHQKPWEDFKYFNAKGITLLRLLEEVIGSVSGHVEKRIMTDHFLEILQTNPKNIAEALKLLQLVLKSSENVDLVEKVLDELLEDRYWNLSYNVVINSSRKSSREQLRVSEHTEGLYESSLLVKYVDLKNDGDLGEHVEYLVSPLEAKANVLFSCVLLETVATLGHPLGAERFQKYVFRILFNLLSSAGNSNYCIHSAGLLALTEVTRIFANNGVRELILKNSDYVMFFVNQSLRDPLRSKSALDVISVILEFCSKDVLGYVELIVNRLLDECAKFHRMMDLAAYLKVFGLFLRNLHIEEKVDEDGKEKSVDEILDSWLAILNPKEEDEEDPQMDTEKDDKEPDAPSTDAKKDLPKNVVIAKEILLVALKHISSQKQSEVLAAMETITYGVAILNPYEDELLPLVHQIWATLSKRFSDDNPVVLRNSFRMLITLAESSKEFIHRRTVDEVVPTLNKILSNSFPLLTKIKDETGGARFTQQFKLVQEILSQYHVVVQRLNIQQKHLDDILSTVAVYMSRQVPSALRTAAKQFFDNLMAYDGPTIHQKLKSCDQHDEEDKQ